jgi:lysophospholipase L1-like esterase
LLNYLSNLEKFTALFLLNSPSLNVKPLHTLLVLSGILILLYVIGYFFPKEGLKIADQTFYAYQWESQNSRSSEKKDISKILETAAKKELVQTKMSAVDSLNDSISETTLQIKSIQTLEFDQKKDHPLKSFFEGLKSAKDNAKTIRILHYGDSQIEADRISDYLRLRLQAEFGGTGIGMLPAVQISQTVGIKQYNSALWNKYNAYVGIDRKVTHKNYGPLISFSNYVSEDDSTEEWLKFTVNKNAGTNVSNFSKLKLFYGNAQQSCQLLFYENDQLKDVDSMRLNAAFNIKQWRVNSSAGVLELRFRGAKSPDIYGLALEGDYGVQLDNIPLRGSSGTFFNQISLQHLKSFYDYLNVKLVILQFGGNALPAIDSEQKAKNFGDYLRIQIQAIKRQFPEISILVVGPADMSVKKGTDFVSHPYIESLRNSIKLAANQTNSAFWDMYEAMGGKNSMPAWVAASPSLAAKDYIHFSPTGARKIAVLLYDAMMKDFANNKYLK